MSVSRSFRQHEDPATMSPATKRPLFTFGPTLARKHSHDAAYGVICRAIQNGKVRGHISIAVMRTELPDRFAVEATFNDLSPDQALDALQIAAARFGVLHRVPASEAIPIAADDADRLRARAEQLVDRVRALGWWERVSARMQWFGSQATFRYSREKVVAEVMRALAEERAAAARREAA